MEYPVEYKTRVIRVDDDALEIRFRYDELCGVWLGDYPYFIEEPRFTPGGRPWRNACYTECPYAAPHPHDDCSSCPHFTREQPNDRIGVCFHDALQKCISDSIPKEEKS